jgi:hypothetical protein
LSTGDDGQQAISPISLRKPVVVHAHAGFSQRFCIIRERGLPPSPTTVSSAL